MKKKDKQRLDEILIEMKELVKEHDIEENHYKADSLLCEALNILGQTELIEAFYNIKKWYS